MESYELQETEDQWGWRESSW